jgi:hypothetical protein
LIFGRSFVHSIIDIGKVIFYELISVLEYIVE